MNLPKWLLILPRYWVVFPAAASCYLPMKNQMKFSPTKTAALCLAALVPFTLSAAWLQTAGRLEENQFLPVLLVFFLLYRWTLKAHLSKALAVYAGVCAVETFPAHLANVLEAYLHSTAWAAGFSIDSSLFQLGLSLLLLAVAWRLRPRLTWVMDELDFPRVWYSTVPLSAVFLLFNVAAEPNSFRMYYAGQPYHLFPLLEICAFALLVCIYVLFYQGAWLLQERAQSEQRSQLLEIQSHQYRALQEHMQQTAQLRHDFRHSVHLLAALAEQGDLESVRTHLAEYDRRLAENTAVRYCANAALNALFGYYEEMAAAAGVVTDWRFDLPDPLTVAELDLAGLFGNLLENGIKGCQTLPEGKRRFSLTAEIQQGNSLYIVSTNSFDGHVIKGKGGYYSTRHSGRGIGLMSITAIVEKYGGSVRFSNSDKEFFVDVVLKV